VEDQASKKFRLMMACTKEEMSIRPSTADNVKHSPLRSKPSMNNLFLDRYSMPQSLATSPNNQAGQPMRRDGNYNSHVNTTTNSSLVREETTQ
jgi:hypothetical protein